MKVFFNPLCFINQEKYLFHWYIKLKTMDYFLLNKLNQNLFLLAEEYRYLISLPTLSEDEANRMAKILEIANKDEFLNCLIEEIEMSNYENQGLHNLLQIILENVI